MADPKYAQLARRVAQQNTHALVEREVTAILSKFRSLNPVEEAFVKAIYNPDRRMR